MFVKGKSIIGRAFKLLIFLLIGALLFVALNLIFTPKWRSTWRSTDTITGFYTLEPNSIDTVILGSSQVITGVSPLQLYQEAGIRSYALGTERQPMLASYYLLLDALRTQPKIKTVVLEVTELFPQCNEPSYRKVFDFMYPSQVKWEGIQDHIQWAKKQDPETAPKLINYLFPVFSYHDRWKELNQDDFTYFLQDRKFLTRGFSIQPKKGAKDPGYEALDIDNLTGFATPDEEALHFLKATISLCQKRNISLLLLKTTRSDWSLEQFNTVLDLSKEYGVSYLDFNTPHRLSSIGFDYSKDILKGSETHLNLNGAGKETAYLADYLTENFPVSDMRGDKSSAQLDRDLVSYRQLCEDARLTQITDWRSYLSRLYRDRYSLLVSVYPDEKLRPTADNSPKAFQRALTQLGLDPRICEGGHYVAALEGGRVLAETWSEEPVEQSATLRDGTYCSLSCDGYSAITAVCSIMLNRVEYVLPKTPGIQIVVYNHETGQIVDTVALQLSAGEDAEIQMER